MNEKLELFRQVSSMNLPADGLSESASLLTTNADAGAVAYIVSRFPKLTETFIVREMQAVEREGISLEFFPLQKEPTNVVQPEAKPYVDRARFHSWAGPAVLFANLRMFLRSPERYISTLLLLIKANWGSLRYLAGAVMFFPKAVKIADCVKNQAVAHIHAQFASHPAAVAWTIWRMTQVPYSFVAHGSDLHRDQHMLFEKTRDAAFVVAISQYNRKMILDVCGDRFASKVHVIHCGIDMGQFPLRQAPTSFQQGNGLFRILCIGTLHEVKGQQYLIEACRLLREGGSRVECRFIGNGPDREKLKRLVALHNLEGCIRFVGRATSEQVAEELSLADCLVAPSVLSSDGRREGIPVVLMEAMASGVPCVASDISGIPELIETEVSGLLVQPKDSEGIAKALQRIMKMPIMTSRLAAEGRKKIQTEFESQSNARQLVRLFEKFGKPVEHELRNKESAGIHLNTLEHATRSTQLASHDPT